jgi:outer membrane receptor protein involved in Fe transport
MPTPNWLIYLAPALLDTEFDEFKTAVAESDLTGNKLASSPEVSFNGLIQYTHQIGPGTLSLQTNFAFRDHQYFSADNLPELAQDSYWLLNARAAYLWTVGDHEFEVAAWGNNILDKEYLVDGVDVTAFGYHTASAGLPAMGGVTFSYRLK